MVRWSELAQTALRADTSDWTTVCPLYSMRRELSRVTLPISWAPTPYCLAVARRAASFVGETETMARAPDSPKRAYSAEAFSGRVMDAPSEEKAGPSLRGLRSGCQFDGWSVDEAKQDSAMA